MQHITPKPKAALPLLIGFGATIFFLPLIYHPGLYLAFAIPQVTFFRTATLILLLLFLLFCARNKIIPDFKSLFHSSALIFLLLFFVIFLFASIFGRAPAISFFGNYFRQQGFFTHLHYLLFFLMLIFIARKVRLIFPVLFAASSLSGTVLAAYGILQKFGIDPLFATWEHSYLFGRIFATLGHPDFLATLFLFTIAASFALIMEQPPAIVGMIGISPPPPAIKALRAVGMIGLILQTIALILTLSRASFLGLLTGILFFTLIYLWEMKRKKWFAAVIGLCIFSMLGFGALQFFNPSSIKLPRVIDRLIIKEESLRSIESRIIIWRGALRLFVDAPFLGYGPETFHLTFPKYQSPKLLALEQYTGTADKPHNFLLELLVSTGAFGLLAYLFFLIALFHRFFRWLKKTRVSPDSQTLASPGMIRGLILASGILAYLVSDLFGFGLTAHSTSLFTFFGLFFATVTPAAAQPQFRKKIFHRGALASILTIAIIMVGLLIYIFNWRSFKADNFFYKTEFQKAAEMNPLEPIYGLRYAEYLFEADKLDEAIAAAKKVLELTRDDSDTEVLFGKIYAALGKTDAIFFTLADETFLRAFKMSPTNPLVLKPWADILFQQGRYENAKSVYEYLIKISPPYWTWTKEELELKPFFTREQYRIFFKDNPDFIDILKNFQKIQEYFMNYTEAKRYREAISRLSS